MIEKDAWYKKVANAIIDAETFDATRTSEDITIYDMIGSHIIKDLDPIFQAVIDAGPRVKGCFDHAIAHLRGIGVKVYIIIPTGQRNRVCVTTNADYIILEERAAELDYNREETKYTQAVSNAVNKIQNQHSDKADAFLGSTQRCLESFAPREKQLPMPATSLFTGAATHQ